MESSGPKAIDTWIKEGPDGRLMGHYVLHEPTRDVAGMLDPVHDDGCDAAVFRWSDLYGTGVARLQFFPDRHCFEGAWTLGDRNPTLDWQSCTRERVTS